MIYRLNEIDLPKSLERLAPRWAGEIVVGLGVLVVVVILRSLIDLTAPGAVPFALLFPALLVATVTAGWRAGAITSVGGGLLTWYLVLSPVRTFALANAAEAVSLVLYGLSAALIVVVAHAFKASAWVVAAERAALQESETRFRLIAEDAPVQLWMGDDSGKLAFANQAQRAFWGLTPETMVGFEWRTTLAEEDREATVAAVAQAVAARAAFEVEARFVRADGEVRTLLAIGRPRFDGSQAYLGMIGIFIDVSETRAYQHRQALLVNELNHRVKNTLATVQSLARQSFRTSDPDTAIATFDARLIALSAAHDILTREQWEDASLSDVIDQAILPWQGGGKARFDLSGPPVRVLPRIALGLAMALHELATNAVKYGALSVERGRVAISWRMEGHSLDLVWREIDGPKVASPTREGFGSRLLRKGLAGDLGQSPELDYAPDGVTCRFWMSLEHGPAQD